MFKRKNRECIPVYAELTAKEAREMAKRKIPNKVSMEVQTVMKEIDEAINNGEFKCVCYHDLSDDCIKILNGLGYRINKLAPNNSIDNIITVKF